MGTTFLSFLIAFSRLNLVHNFQKDVHEVLVGDFVKFVCEYPRSVKFTYLGGRLPDNTIVSTNLFIVYNIQLNNSGLYGCYGSYKGDFIDETSELLVAEEDANRVYPKEIVAKLGETVEFTCLSYRPTNWRHNHKKKLQMNAHTAANNSIIIKDINYDNEGIYECRGWDEMKKYFFSRTKLVIESGDKISPLKQSAQIGDVAIFKCNSDSVPEWKFVGHQSLPKNAYIEESTMTLAIFQVNAQSEGQYECIGQQNGQPFTARGLLALSMRTEDRISPKFVKVTEGQSVTFTCEASEMIWELTNARGANELPHGDKIEIKSAGREHQGIYTCYGSQICGSEFASNAILVVVSRDQILVEDSPLKEQYEPIQGGQVIVRQGENKLIHCFSTVFPKWSYNSGMELPPEVEVNEKGSLFIKNAKHMHAGEYRCEGTTEYYKYVFSIVKVIIVDENGVRGPPPYAYGNQRAYDPTGTISFPKINAYNLDILKQQQEYRRRHEEMFAAHQHQQALKKQEEEIRRKQEEMLAKLEANRQHQQQIWRENNIPFADQHQQQAIKRYQQQMEEEHRRQLIMSTLSGQQIQPPLEADNRGNNDDNNDVEIASESNDEDNSHHEDGQSFFREHAMHLTNVPPEFRHHFMNNDESNSQNSDPQQYPDIDGSYFPNPNEIPPGLKIPPGLGQHPMEMGKTSFQHSNNIPPEFLQHVKGGDGEESEESLSDMVYTKEVTRPGQPRVNAHQMTVDQARDAEFFRQHGVHLNEMPLEFQHHYMNDDDSDSQNSDGVPPEFQQQYPDIDGSYFPNPNEMPHGLRQYPKEIGESSFQHSNNVHPEFLQHVMGGVGEESDTVYTKEVARPGQPRVNPHQMTVDKARDAYFSCLSSTPAKWTKDDSDILPLNAVVLPNNELLVKKVVEVSEGIYYCEGTYDNGTSFKAMGELEVVDDDEDDPEENSDEEEDSDEEEPQDSSKGISVSPISQTVYPKMDAEFECRHKSNVKWSFNGRPVLGNVEVQRESKGVHKLIVHSATKENSGLYLCESLSTGVSDVGELVVANGHCSSFPPFDHGRVFHSGHSYGDFAQYKCDDGYTMRGVSVRRCMDDGEWSGKTPVCTFGDSGGRRQEPFAFFSYQLILCVATLKTSAIIPLH